MVALGLQTKAVPEQQLSHEPVQLKQHLTIQQIVYEPLAKLIPEGIPELVFCKTQGNMKRINVSNAQLGKDLAKQRGWEGQEWDALLELWSCESQWEITANNPTSSAYGIPQMLLKTHLGGENTAQAKAYKRSAEVQIQTGLDYIANRKGYGSPSKALKFHHEHNWY